MEWRGGERVRQIFYCSCISGQDAESLFSFTSLCIVQNSYFEHIMSKTKARIHLRGRGSGYMEPTSGRESFEALYIYLQHSTPEGLKEARTLCDDLVKHVHKEYESFKQQRTAYRPPFPYTPFPGWACGHIIRVVGYLLCATLVVSLCCHCTISTLSLCCHYTISTLSLCCHCAISTLSLHFVTVYQYFVSPPLVCCCCLVVHFVIPF